MECSICHQRGTYHEFDLDIKFSNQSTKLKFEYFIDEYSIWCAETLFTTQKPSQATSIICWTLTWPFAQICATTTCTSLLPIVLIGKKCISATEKEH